jgi:hypothetical protein
MFERFDDLVVSCELRMAKPDPEIFQVGPRPLRAARRGNAAYFDDVPRYIEVAAALGIHARVFTDAPTFRTQLAELGLGLVVGRRYRAPNRRRPHIGEPYRLGRRQRPPAPPRTMVRSGSNLFIVGHIDFKAASVVATTVLGRRTRPFPGHPLLHLSPLAQSESIWQRPPFVLTAGRPEQNGRQASKAGG